MGPHTWGSTRIPAHERHPLSVSENTAEDPTASAQMMQETLACLSLYVSHHAWTQLTTPQKECLADAIDVHFSDEPLVGKVDRWWRDQKPGSR